MLSFSQIHKRRVEGSAAQVIDKQPAFHTILAVTAVAAGKLNRGGRWLVQQPKHLEARRPGCLLRQKSLVAVGVRWYTKHHLEPVVFAGAQGGFVHELASQGHHHFGHQERHIVRLAGNINRAAGTSFLQLALERTYDGPGWFTLLLQCLPSINPFVS